MKVFSVIEALLKHVNKSAPMMTWWNGNIFHVTGPFVRGIHRSSVNFPHKGQWRGAFMLSLIRAWINGWVNNRDTGDLGRHRAHYDVIVMQRCWIAIYEICPRERSRPWMMPSSHNEFFIVFLWLCEEEWTRIIHLTYIYRHAYSKEDYQRTMGKYANVSTVSNT